MTEVINPVSSYLEAREDYARLRRLTQLSVQGAFLLMVPMAVLLFTFGRDLLTLWVGPAYASAYPILVLLTLGMGAGATQACIQSILFGIGRHKGLVKYRLGETAAFLVLGGLALKFSGLEAFSAVIAVTLLITSLILVPRHACQVLGMSLGAYLTEGCLKPCLATIPYAAVLYGLHSCFTVKSWFELLSMVAAGGLVYLATLLWMGLRSGEDSRTRWTSLRTLAVVANRARPILSNAAGIYR